MANDFGFASVVEGGEDLDRVFVAITQAIQNRELFVRSFERMQGAAADGRDDYVELQLLRMAEHMHDTDLVMAIAAAAVAQVEAAGLAVDEGASPSSLLCVPASPEVAILSQLRGQPRVVFLSHDQRRRFSWRREWLKAMMKRLPQEHRCGWF